MLRNKNQEIVLTQPIFLKLFWIVSENCQFVVMKTKVILQLHIVLLVELIFVNNAPNPLIRLGL